MIVCIEYNIYNEKKECIMQLFLSVSMYIAHSCIIRHVKRMLQFYFTCLLNCATQQIYEQDKLKLFACQLRIFTKLSSQIIYSARVIQTNLNLNQSCTIGQLDNWITYLQLGLEKNTPNRNRNCDLKKKLTTITNSIRNLF